jgi:integrase
VFNSIRGAEIASSRKRDLLSALRRIESLLGAPLAIIPADVAQLRDKLAHVRPAQHGLSAKTWANLRSSLVTSIEMSGVTPILRTARMQYSPAWRELLTASDERTHYGLTRFGRFCSANCVEPREVDDRVFQAFTSALHTSSLHPKAKTIARDSATLWNRLCAKRPELNLAPVARPCHRRPLARLSWNDLPKSFRSDAERHLAWAAGSDPFAADARPKPLAARSVRLRREQILTAVSSLVKTGTAFEQIKSLADLVGVDVFKAIIKQRFQSGGGKPSRFNLDLATTLIRIAQEWVHLPKEEIAELKRLRSRLPTPPPGLVEKHKVLLRALDDSMLPRLMALPDQLLKRALRRPISFRALADAQAALAIAIPLHAPLRATNLAGLAFGESIFLPKRDTQETQIFIAAHEAKTREPYATVLPPRLTVMIRTYGERLLRPQVGANAKYLFDNGAGKQKNPTTISWLLKRTVKRHLGLTMTEHQFRHVTAKLMRDAGADYETIRQLLGHRSIKTTVAFYAGLDTALAARRHSALLEQKLEEAQKARALRPRRVASGARDWKGRKS